MKNYFVTTLTLVIFFTVTSAFSAEVKLDENQITCENADFGIFEFKFLVNDKVIDTEYYSDESTPPKPSWEILESELTQFNFTSGKLLLPSGVKSSVPGVKLRVLRSAWEGPRKGTIDLSISIPKQSLPLELLSVDHNHPDKYESNELGAQSFVWFNENLAQLFFKCK